MSYTIGVYEVYPVDGTSDVVVFGKCNGTVKPGTTAYLTNIGVDDDEPVKASVVGLEIPKEEGWEAVEEASDRFVSVMLKDAAKANIKKATVVHDMGATFKEKYDTYINALGDSIVAKADLNLSNEEMAKLSFTDLCELVRLYDLYHSDIRPDITSEEKENSKVKREALALYACSRLYGMKELYVVGSKNTGEPFMFSRSKLVDGEVHCTPPVIRILTKSYLDMYKMNYDDSVYEFYKVDNCEDKQGIKRFFQSAFYENGAWGVELLNEDILVKAEIVADADSRKKREEVRIANPNLVRWMLLMGQMPAPETDEAKRIYQTYFKFFSDELPKAQLILPVQNDDGSVTKDANRGMNVKKKMRPAISEAINTGVRDAVKLFTDFRRLGMVFDNTEWTAVVTNMNGVIGRYDVIINPTRFVRASSFVSQEMYAMMTKQ